MGQFIFGLFAGIIVGLVMEWVIDWAGLLPDRSVRKQNKPKNARDTVAAEKSYSADVTATTSARSLPDTDASGE